MTPEVHIYADLTEASKALAENLVNIVQDCVSKRGFFSLALSGGRTPRTLYGLLASEYSSQIPWNDVHLFWSDERCVPKDHPDSNYAMAYNILISRVSLPSQHIHRIPAEIDPPEKAAESYEKILRDFFPTPPVIFMKRIFQHKKSKLIIEVSVEIDKLIGIHRHGSITNFITAAFKKLGGSHIKAQKDIIAKLVAGFLN